VHSEFALSGGLAKAVGCDHFVGAGVDQGDIRYGQAVNLGLNIGDELGVVIAGENFFVSVPGDLWLGVGVDDNLELGVFVWVDSKVFQLRNLRHQVHVKACLNFKIKLVISKLIIN
jgi:hypothetical protein